MCSAFEGIGDVRWLSSDPPLAAVERIWPTYEDSVRVPVIFEGCTPVASGDLRVGPGDVFAVLDDATAILWWHGRELGRVPGDKLTFAPPR